MCRNVVIYFTDTAKEDLYRKFFAALKPGGYLFVGSTERIFSAKEIGFTTSIPFFYQKPMEGKATEWRNAS
jgi:chemotaxis protein methyltransferase CheR